MVELLVKDNVLYEAILTAVYEDKPYAAPVGFIKRGNEVEVKVYKGSFLSKVTLACSTVVLNITHKPELFVKTALKWEQVTPFKPEEDIVIKGKLPILVGSLGYIVLEKVSTEDFGDHVIIKYVVKDVEVSSVTLIEPYTRCYSSLIEMLIYVTKVKGIKTREKKALYIDKAREFLEVINKTCNEEYRGIAERLQVLMAKWLGE